MNDYLIHEAVRNLGEHDLTALYAHKEPTFHFMQVMRDMIDKAILDVFQEGKIKKGTDLYNKFIEMFPGGDSKIGKKEIVRFVKFSERKPVKDGYYCCRLNSGGLVISFQFEGIFSTTYDSYLDEWLEIIPAKKEFDKTKVRMEIEFRDGNWKTIARYGSIFTSTDSTKPDAIGTLWINWAIGELERLYYETE